VRDAIADSNDASLDNRDGSPDAGGTSDAGDGGIVPPTGYKLVWHDEFDLDGRPSVANWKYENGFVRNEELQWYQPDNARVEGGLPIRTIKQVARIGRRIDNTPSTPQRAC
jgi:hypothetical protein